jgi:hypothetical protein
MKVLHDNRAQGYTSKDRLSYSATSFACMYDRLICYVNTIVCLYIDWKYIQPRNGHTEAESGNLQGARYTALFRPTCNEQCDRNAGLTGLLTYQGDGKGKTTLCY